MRKDKYPVVIIIMITIFILMGFSFPTPILYAQNNEVQKLKQKISELESKIKELEALHVQYDKQKKALPNPGDGWQNRKNWRSLEPGMSSKKVQDLLGKPIKKIEGVKTFWYYPNIYCGYVSFDEKGNLIGWNEP